MNQDSAESAMPSSARVGREYLVVHGVERRRQVEEDERDEALAARRDSGGTEGLCHREEGCLSGVRSLET